MHAHTHTHTRGQTKRWMDGGSPRQPSEGLRAAREELRAVMAAALRRQDTKGSLVMGVNHELLIRSDLRPAWDAGLPLSLPGPSASSLWINPSFRWTEAEPDGCLRWYWLPLKSDWTPQVPNLKLNLLTVIVWLMTDWFQLFLNLILLQKEIFAHISTIKV